MSAGWELAPLRELLEVQNGYAFDAKKFTTENGVPLIRIRDLKEGNGTETNYTGQFDRDYLVNGGDLLIGMDGEFRCHEWKGPPSLLNQRVCRLRNFNGNLEPRFLYYGINKYLEEIEDATSYTTVKHLSSKTILGIEFPHPPLPEQQRIVGKLDAAFAALTEAQAHVERNRANARELFESYLNGVFEGKGDGWVERLLSDFIEVKHGYAYDGKYFEKGGPSDHPILLTPGNFSEEGTLVCTVKNTTRTSEASPDEYHFEINDLAIVMTDLSSKMKILGKAAFIRERGILHNQRIGKVISRDPDVLNEYLYYFFLTDAFLANIKLTATGTMVRHTAPKRITANKIPLPPNKRDQQRIVSQLDLLRKETATLETTYQQKLSELAGLKKAVLGAAFRGEL